MQRLKTHKIEMVLIGLVVFPLIGYSNPLNRDSDPVVLKGIELRSLNRVAVDHIVGFRWQGSWEQIPIQIDERKYVDFGVVYGDPAVGHGTLAYTDPETYVGLDHDPYFDGDDELVFMVEHAGNPAPPTIACPEGVFADTQVQVEIYDSLDGRKGFVYLFESDGSLSQNADQDLVVYSLNLLRGPFMTTYNKGNGHNPEDSEIYTDAYRTHFSDRWIRDELQIFAGEATGVDILDRHKTGRGPGDCSRNENTASNGEGAFFVNKDGCIRAIRSYMGYNSGPYIQRDHFFYQKRHDCDTFWRVHVAKGGREVYDYSPEARSMIYHNDVNLDGVLVDGEPDDVIIGPINWEMLTGQQGTLVICHSIDTDIPNYKTVSYYSDDTTPGLTQCSGDQYEFGVSGLEIWDWPNTDPTLGAYNTLTLHRTAFYEMPDRDIDVAMMHHQQVITPLEITVTPLHPAAWLIYVDGDAPHDPGPHDPSENGSAEHPFDSIQKAIDNAFDTDVIVVMPGTYTGEGNHDIDFAGKAITIKSKNGPQDCIIDCQGAGRGFVFQSRETPDSILQGFTITNGKARHGAGVYCDRSSPTIANSIFQANSASYFTGRVDNGRGGGLYCEPDANPKVVNCTFYNNSAGRSGGAVFSIDGRPEIVNCILWGNTPDEIAAATVMPLVSHSNIQGGFEGEGNIDSDPLFANPEAEDFHLMSQIGCWDPQTQTWVKDEVASPCIDAGDPKANWAAEPLPNGSRINMGAYGGTDQASLSIAPAGE